MKSELLCGEHAPLAARGVIGGWHEAETEKSWFTWYRNVELGREELPAIEGIRLHPKGHFYRPIDVARHHIRPELYVRYVPLYLVGTGLALRELGDFEAKMLYVAESLPVLEMSDSHAMDLAGHLTQKGARQLFKDAEELLPANFWNAVGHQHHWLAGWRHYRSARPQRTWPS